MTAHIYVAGAYGRRDEANTLANELWDRGFVITSRWHAGPENPPGIEHRRFVMQNWHDLLGADAVVALLYPECHGTLFEVGGAIVTPGIEVFLVGEKGHPYHSMAEHDDVVWTSRTKVVDVMSDAFKDMLPERCRQMWPDGLCERSEHLGPAGPAPTGCVVGGKLQKPTFVTCFPERPMFSEKTTSEIVEEITGRK